MNRSLKKCLAIAALCLLASPAWAQPEFKIIGLQHRLAEELLPVLQPLAGANGSVSAYGNQLIVNAEPADLANIETTIRQLDIARRNWRISVSHDSQDRRQSRRIGVAGSADGGNVRVQIPDTQGRIPRDVTLTANERERSWTQNGEMTLTVLDGTQAYLSVGQQIPYSSTWGAFTRHYAQTAQTTDWVEVSTGFMVRPRQIGDMVDIEITPRLAQPGGNGVIDFTALATHIRTRPGEWLDLGGLLGSRDEVSRAILSSGGTQSGNASGLRIKVE